MLSEKWRPCYWLHRQFTRAPIILLATILFSSVHAKGDSVGPDVERYYETHLKDLFEWFHQHPELGFQEHKTASRLADELNRLDIEVTEGIGGTGLVGVVTNGTGPSLLIRADMDGLPIRESTNLPYASTVRQVTPEGDERPVMHACGHDAHMAILVGTAKMLMENREDWRGRVMFVGQPAEEKLSGAKRMLEDGLYEEFGVPDYALAAHVIAGAPAGRIWVRRGIVHASADSVDITVRGAGGHGASPHATQDPIYMAAQLVLGLQGLVGRRIDPTMPAVISVGSIRGGSTHNIIPDTVELKLTVRADNEDTRNKLLQEIESYAVGVARANGLPEDLLPVVEHGFEGTPANANDNETVTRVAAAWQSHFGYDPLIHEPKQTMAAEDFAYFSRPTDVASVYFNIGATPADVEQPAPHHSSRFEISPEPTIRAGVEAMYQAAITLLND